MKALFCFDGSANASKGVPLLQSLIQSKILNQLTSCYVYDHRKTYLPIQYQISQSFQGESKASKYIKPLQQNLSVLEEILVGYQLQKCNLLVLGFYGRKGEKPNQRELTPKVRRLVYDETLPLLIIKSDHVRSQDQLKIVYAYDGSENSKKGLELLKSAVGINAKITSVYCSSKDQTKQPLIIRNDLREFKTRNKGGINLQTKVIDSSTSPRESLLNYINEVHPDLVVITRNGWRGELTSKQFVGQTASLILTQGDSNIWIIQ